MPVLVSFLVIALVALLGWHVMSQPGYSSGSRTGYNLGLAGAVMMLMLFLYPLRKHVRWLNSAGPLREWLNLHMLLGICGPLLILFHSRFSIDSTNAGVAVASMLVVAGSGIVGRFIYTRIHHELRGRKLEAMELRSSLAASLERIEGGRALPDAARKSLESFEAFAQRTPRGFLARGAKFLFIAPRRYWTAWRIRHGVAAMPGHRRIAAQANGYLLGLQRVAQFSIYERLFSLWHVLHIPLVALLVLSVTFHVIAVHMY